ncbi:thiolase family protein [Neobacillus niacini]|uniref:thiolase family protein n=1 Tax=Neobacillus niacini TaxID=86668 RepID=UPI0021CB75E3|nr:thiolase family protein [Neobacillus niacini]MCM3766167.1 thiolase family protein [Neobacillus niacini]
MTEVVIAGVGMHEFGRYNDKDYRTLGSVAAQRALKDANMNMKDVQAAFCANVYEVSASGHNVLERLGLPGIPIVNVENACASGASAVRLAYQAIKSGQYDIVLAVGFEKSPRGFLHGAGYDHWQESTGLGANPLYFALNIHEHMVKYGTTKEQLAHIAYKSHKHAVHNRYAMFRKELSVEEILQARMVCDPLTLYMLCAPNDGGAAAVICNKETAERFTQNYVTIAASVLETRRRRDMFVPAVSAPAQASYPFLAERAAQSAYKMAGLGPEDIDVAEIQDVDAGSEIIYSESLGFCPIGEGGPRALAGETSLGGRIPINVSGGILSRGEPVGASSLGQIAEITWQLRGEAGPNQVQGAKVALSHSEGAGGNSCVTILVK